MALIYTLRDIVAHMHTHTNLLCLHKMCTILEGPSHRKDPIGLHVQCTMLAYPKLAAEQCPEAAG